MPRPDPVTPGTPVDEYPRLLADQPSTAPGTRDVRLARQAARRHLPATTALVPPAATE